jgi:hypothetical protein
VKDKLSIFEAHGVEWTGENGDEKIGTCPFTGKRDKFYLNTKKWVWDSKTAGFGGSVSTFLEKIQEMYQDNLTKPLLKKLAEHRGLPEDAFTAWGIGWNGKQYTLLVRDPAGHAVDIRMYALGKRVLSTKGVSVGLWGAEYLTRHPADPVFICEGEWDAIALRWLMRQVGYTGVVVAVPGVGTFKDEWRTWMSSRRVHSLFDADAAGEQGEISLQKKLKGSVQELTFVHWPDGVKDGFDVRDYVIYGAVERSDPTGCWNALLRKFQTYPRMNPPKEGTAPAASVNPNTPQRKSAWDKKEPSFDDVCTVFKKWLYLEHTVGIEIALAVVASQDIEGPPVWMFTVAPPGGGKTEVLNSLIGMPQIYLQSSLTPHALISGANFKGEQDPSLVPKLDGKVLVIKDFTTILSMRDTEKDEIFGILRDAYDGRCGKVFGTGIERSYESRFTILAAVTPRIYDLSQQHHSLGERFLKCGVGNNLQHTSERDIIRRAIDNINSDSTMKWELQDVVHAFMRKTRSKQLPALSASMYDKLISLAMFGARLRGTVSRDTYRNDIITSKPSAEIGSRLGIQLAKLAKSIAWIHGRSEVTETDYRVVKKVMLDTISQRIEDVVRVILQKCPTSDDTLSTQDIANVTRYPVATVGRILADLHILDVVERTGTNYRFFWTLSNYIRQCLDTAEVYKTEADLDRPVRRWVKMTKRRGRPSNAEKKLKEEIKKTIRLRRKP